ncbi:MAG: recombination mediator RecR [Bdellovibrionales bacterium]
MIAHVPSLEALVHELAKLPGIGPKTAQRLAYHILKSKSDYVAALRRTLQEVKDKVHECPQCYSYTENTGACQYCADTMRTDKVLCVVEDASDITRIESSGVFKGRYHVLQGAISPLEGVTPDSLKIKALMERIRRSQTTDHPVCEVILALDADLEGDTTVLYLAKLLREMGVSITRIAHGVPIGGDIDYIDYRTLGRAIENRVQL